MLSLLLYPIVPFQLYLKISCEKKTVKGKEVGYLGLGQWPKGGKCQNEWIDLVKGVETLQCRRRLFGPSSLHQLQSHPASIPLAPCIHPGGPPDTQGQFSMVNQHNPDIFGLWEENGAPGGNPHRHEENEQTPHSDPNRESNPCSWCCEAAVLTTMPLCCPTQL